MTREPEFEPEKIVRPDPALFRYYLWVSLLTGPLAPIVLLPMWLRYVTLRYRFDESGVSMQWGFLFRKEVYLTHRRIQDIHLTRNILQRWMRLATIRLQTASGSSDAEMTIEGIMQADMLRDYLYGKMRGARDERQVMAEPEVQGDGPEHDRRATQALCDIRDALQVLVDRQSKGAQS